MSSHRRSTRSIVEWLDLLDDPRVFSSRIFWMAWAPFSLAAILAETPNPRLGTAPWAVAVIVATLLAWPAFLGAGRLVSLVRQRRVRRVLTPTAFGFIGLVRGVVVGAISEHFALLADVHWSARIIGGLFAGIVLTSAVAAVERSGLLLIDLQREARWLRLERDTVATPLDEPTLHATWLAIVRATLEAHFAEKPWTPEARAALERNGAQRLADQVARELAAARPLAPRPPGSMRVRLSENTHLRRLVELATARVGGARAALTITLALTVASIHGGSIGLALESLVTVLVVLVAAASTLVLATAFEQAHRRFLRRAPLGMRFVLITVSLLALGFAVGFGAALVDRLVLDSARPAVTMLLVGMVPAIAVVIGWASIIIDGATTYSTLLRVENQQSTAFLLRRGTERERIVRLAARRFDEAVASSWLPLVRVIARDTAAWLSVATRERVIATVAVLDRALGVRSVPEVLDALPHDWEGLALVDCFVDDDVMDELAVLPPEGASALLDEVRTRVTMAVVEGGAQSVEIAIRREHGALVVDSWHNGGTAIAL